MRHSLPEMENKPRKASLLKLLERTYGDRWPWPPGELHDPFENLVLTVLSQNTNDRNSMRAYRALSKRFRITPSALVSASVDDIKDAIRPGGLYNVKARRIKEIARIVLEEFDGDLTKVLGLPQEEARKKLRELPGVGDKTADVLLAFCGRGDVIPIDTHLNRVSKRLGLVPLKAGYAEVQEALNRVIPVGKRLRGHVLLIMLGREYCKARGPRCHECPLVVLCAHGQRRKYADAPRKLDFE